MNIAASCRIALLVLLVLAGTAGSAAGQARSLPPLIIDSHTHYQATDAGEKSFLEVYGKYHAMACLLMDKRSWERGIAFAKAHPDRVIPYAAVDIDSPTVLDDIRKAHAMGFVGIGELFALGRRNYDDPAYDSLWALCDSLKMPVAPHTGIHASGKMSRMRPSFLADVASRHPNLVIHAAHFGNPWYDEAGEATRRNGNLYFDMSGSSLIKKENDPKFWLQFLWWGGDVGKAHMPKDAMPPFEKILFATDEPPEAFAENVRRFGKMLDACGVDDVTRAKSWGLTIARIHGIKAPGGGGK